MAWGPVAPCRRARTVRQCSNRVSGHVVMRRKPSVRPQHLRHDGNKLGHEKLARSWTAPSPSFTKNSMMRYVLSHAVSCAVHLTRLRYANPTCNVSCCFFISMRVLAVPSEITCACADAANSAAERGVGAVKTAQAIAVSRCPPTTASTNAAGGASLSRCAS